MTPASGTRARASGRANHRVRGGTLVEVVIALVLLAVGLLALQALALAAGRLMGASDRTSRYASLAERSVEATLASLAADSIPPDLDCPLSDGGRLIRVVSSGGTAARYRIIVAPPAHRPGHRRLDVNGYAYSPRGFVAAAAPEPCP